MRTSFHSKVVLLLVLPACRGIGDPLDDYYGDGQAPSISGLDVTSEAGNLGGGTVTLSGSGFGEDPTQVTVQFGTLNAKVVSASESALEIEVPRGPIQGGAVDVMVGTEGGFARLEDGYTYEVSDLTANETGYVSIVNDWHSCYGGGDKNSAIPGCETFAYIGLTGLQGDGEFLTDKFPRVHSWRMGFYGGTDTSPDQWKVEIPGNSFYPSAIEDLRRDVGPVTVRNVAREETDFCVDTSYLGVYTYPQGVQSGTDEETGAPTYYDGLYFQSDITALAGDMSCDAPDTRHYDLGKLEFCEIPYYDESEHEYQADWPISQPFFANPSANNESLDEYGPVDIELDIPEMGLTAVPLTIPEYVEIEGTKGFDGGATPYWALTNLESCFDGNGDGTATLDEEALQFTWTPSSVGVEENVEGPVKAMETYLVVSITELRLGWAFGEGYPARATIRVDDWNEFDEATGQSSVSVPNWVMYQFPTLGGNWGYQEGNNPLSEGSTTWASVSGNFGYLVIDVNRITEYQLTADDGSDIIFAYSTGDFGFIVDWTNPIDAGRCGDCLDNDADGWTDVSDPDCEVGEDEDGGGYGIYGCDDGLDNDADGDVDGEDSDCTSGTEEESNCHDNVDNDEDGYTDEVDGECVTKGLEQELGNDDPTWGCSNGVDDDADGWVDVDDPACVDGTTPEDDGFQKDLTCNNGLDDDGHGDVDSSDPFCWRYGPSSAAEEPTYGNNACSDGKDNDADGYVDDNDPACEFAPFSSEGEAFDDPEEHPTTKECYDGIDNDKDTLTDALDPGCWDIEGVPDGNFADESSA